MSEIYLLANGAAPTIAAPVPLDTGVAIITMLQVKMGADRKGRAKIIEWGISFDGFVAALPVRCELFANSVAATVTAHAVADIINLDPHAETHTDDNPFALSTTETGFDATVEGTPASVRMLDLQFVAPTNQYIKQWPLGREPEFDPDEYIRIRVTADTAVNAYCYVIVEV